jgi:hypothetical protein
MVKSILASIGALAATVLLAAGAMADGAAVQHFNLNSPQQCYDKGPFMSCFTATGEETDVQSSSGNFSGDVNTTFSYVTTYNGAVIGSGYDSIHEHVLLTNSFTVLQEGGMHSTSTFTWAGTTCTYSFDLHVTGLNPSAGTGRIQYDNFSYVCV